MTVHLANNVFQIILGRASHGSRRLSAHFQILVLLSFCLFVIPLAACNRGALTSRPEIVKPTTASGPIAWRHFTTSNDPVKTITMDGDTLWMGTSKGIIRFDTGSGEYETYSPTSTGGGFVSKGIYVIAIDPKGDKWVGTYGGGLSRFDGKTWQHYSSADGLGDDWVYDIAFDRDGKMWVATWDGVSIFDGSRFTTTYRVADGLADKWVYTLVLDNDGIFWFGTEAGVSRFDRKSWTTYTHKDGVGADVKESAPTGAATSPIPSRPGSGAEGGGSYNYGSSSSRHHMTQGKENIGANPNFIISSVVDRKNQKWFGTWGAGLSRFDGKTWTSFTKEQGLGGNYVLALALDEEGRVWAGTDGGASWFDGTKWRTITVADGLPDNFVFSILFDRRGHRWFGTLKGLSVFRGTLPA